MLRENAALGRRHAGFAALVGATVACLLVVLWTVGSTAWAKERRAHEFAFVSIDGAPLAMKDFAGRPVLVVNTASQCGFTPQYRDLQTLWQDYGDRGLVVLGVPSNDFGGQEPGSTAEIKQFCELNYGIEFPMTDKQRVVGADAHPFYRWAASALGADNAPRWNFHKYLVGGDGRLLAAWPSRVKPTDAAVRAAIEAQLAAAR